MKSDQEKRENFLRAFGSHLKSWRTQKGLSTIEMAKKMIMDTGNYTRLETGKNNPTIYTLKKFCDVLDIELSELLDNFKD